MKKIICLLLVIVLCQTTVFALTDATKTRTKFDTWDEITEDFWEGIIFPGGSGIAVTKVFEWEKLKDYNHLDEYENPARVVKLTVAKDFMIAAMHKNVQISCLSPKEDNWFRDDKYFNFDKSCDGYTLDDLGVKVYVEYESKIKGYYEDVAWKFNGNSKFDHLKIKIDCGDVYYYDITILDKNFSSDTPEESDEPAQEPEKEEKPEEVAEEKEETIVLATSFYDVSEKHWAYDAVMNMQKRGLFSGVSAPINGIGRFAPNKTMTRSELLLVLVRELFSKELKEEQKKADATSPWWQSAYNVAIDKGLLYSNEFCVNGVLKLTNDVRREEMAMLLDRAGTLNGLPSVTPASSEQIPDYDKIDKNYRSAVCSVYSRGFIAGIDSKGTFHPKGILTRAQAAVVLNRFVSAN